MRFADSINDYLIYGLDEEFFYRVPLMHRMRGLSELLPLLPENACVVHAHPFRDDMGVETPHAGLFGMEVFNGGTEPFRNGLARQYAAHYGLAATSGSDIHDMTRLATGGICTPQRIRTPEDLTAVLRSGAYTLIENARSDKKEA